MHETFRIIEPYLNENGIWLHNQVLFYCGGSRSNITSSNGVDVSVDVDYLEPTPSQDRRIALMAFGSTIQIIWRNFGDFYARAPLYTCDLCDPKALPKMVEFIKNYNKYVSVLT